MAHSAWRMGRSASGPDALRYAPCALRDRREHKMSVVLHPLTFGTVNQSTTPAALNGGVSLPCAAVLVQCDPDNSNDLFVGDGGSQPLQLKPGQAARFEIVDAALLYVAAAGGTQRANWVAGPRDLAIHGTGLTGGGGG